MSQGYRQGRDETLRAMGLEPDPDEPDEFVWYYPRLGRRGLVESKRSRPQGTDAPPSAGADAGDL